LIGLALQWGKRGFSGPAVPGLAQLLREGGEFGDEGSSGG
jgi:hypothetical protein